MEPIVRGLKNEFKGNPGAVAEALMRSMQMKALQNIWHKDLSVTRDGNEISFELTVVPGQKRLRKDHIMAGTLALLDTDKRAHLGIVLDEDKSSSVNGAYQVLVQIIDLFAHGAELVPI